MICLLCGSRVNIFAVVNGKKYYRCRSCRSVMLDPAAHPSLEDEKLRYDQHNNDINDPRYQNFVMPLVEAVEKDCSVEGKGLDFGAGSGPVAAAILGERGYKVTLYDIFYHPDQSVFNKSYDYIICSEVIEHFRSPADEFRKLRRLLRQGGRLYCMTSVYSEEIDFENWHYKDDPTHLFFYHRFAFKWIKENIKFSELLFKGRVIIYRR
ncbi:MAG TPA: class I SAM-dependent methyltransferase [Firmicutes bacterium]|nr:class I SAM-dependent methyltransferase [Bacillota bacterium]